MAYACIVGSEEYMDHGPWDRFAQAFLIDPTKLPSRPVKDPFDYQCFDEALNGSFSCCQAQKLGQDGTQS